MTDLQALLGTAIGRHSDDDDVVEAHLLRSLDRWGDRPFLKADSIWERDSRIGSPDRHEMPDDEGYSLSLYEAELARIDRRFQSRGSQGRD